MRSLIRTTISAAALATALAGGLTACGNDSSTAADPAGSSTSAGSSASASDQPSDEPSDSSPPPSSTSSSPPPDGPACGTVWKAGATLARGYQGCVDQGAFVKRDLIGCSSGQRLARYADHFYAAMGGRVYETESVLDKDRGYRDAVAVCRG